MSLTALWNNEELSEIFSVQIRGMWKCFGISIDTRTLEQGDLFFALKGPASDGHDFVKMAIAKGAVAAVVSKPVKGINSNLLIVVEDVKEALATLGKAGRARVDIPIVAITGSAGKTGTKEALKAALSRNKKVHASVLSYNNDIGVPLSLARMPRDAEYGIFELGMNHKGELRELVKMVRPHVAMITTVEMAHSAYFESVEEIADSKAEIFEGLEDGGVAVLNHDNPHYERLVHKADQAGVGKVISFGSDSTAHVNILRQVFHDTCSCVIADVMGKIMTYKIGMLGHHWVLNSLAVLAIVEAVGGDIGLAGLSLAELKPLKGRGRRHQIFFDGALSLSFLLIDESYNANPASMNASFNAMSQVSLGERGRRIAVLGDMAELGEDSEALHAGLSVGIKANKIDRVYTLGKHMEFLSQALDTEGCAGHFEDRAALESALVHDLRCGDAIMVKGSNSSRMTDIVEKLLELDTPEIKQAV